MREAVGGTIAAQVCVLPVLASTFGSVPLLGLIATTPGLLLVPPLMAGSAALSVAWVVAAQGVSGIAKDLTKTASKSAIKLTAGEASGTLFRWVAWFTGSKNATKGAGFFVGGLLLQWAGFQQALWLMAAMLGLFLHSAMMPPRVLCMSQPM